MLRISLIELLIKGIPEGIISIFGLFILTKTKFDSKKFLFSSISLIFLTYLIRFLPLSYGVNTMLSLLVIIVIAVVLNSIDLSKSIKATLIIAAIIILSETITVGFMQIYLGKEKLNLIMGEPISKSIASIPSTIIYGIVVAVIFFVYRKKFSYKKDNDGEDIV